MQQSPGVSESPGFCIQSTLWQMMPILSITENFRTMLMMEVGALFVGKIENRPRRASVKRGEEKGNFAFGGSTIVLITEKNAVKPDEDILKN